MGEEGEDICLEITEGGRWVVLLKGGCGDGLCLGGRTGEAIGELMAEG